MTEALTPEQRRVRTIIRLHVHYRVRSMGMSMWNELDNVDIEALADDIIKWADRRTK